MTVREMIAALSTLPADALVVLPDTYTESEGWGDAAADPVLIASRVVLDEQGRAYIVGEDPEDEDGEDWDEDEED